MSKSKALFDSLEQRYRIAFEKTNGYSVHNLFFQKGFVFIQTKPEYSANHYRVSVFETMTQTLENRVLKQKISFEEIHDKFQTLFSNNNFEEAKIFINSFNKENTDVGELKSVLVVTKSFKDHEVICEARKNLLDLIEKKLGQKLA